MSQHDLGKCVTDSLEQYFRDLDGEKPAGLQRGEALADHHLGVARVLEVVQRHLRVDVVGDRLALIGQHVVQFLLTAEIAAKVHHRLGRKLVQQLAVLVVPPAGIRATGPQLVVPSLTVTVPTGASPCAATLTVTAYGWPTTEGLGDAAVIVVVVGLTTVRVTSLPVPPT